MQAHVTVSAGSAADEENARREAVGVLKERPGKIPREKGGLDALVTRYLDKTIGQYEKQRGVPEPMQQMLAKMESVVVDVSTDSVSEKEESAHASRDVVGAIEFRPVFLG